MRYPPDALRLYASAEARDLSSRTFAARQTAVRTRPAAFPSQSSSAALQQSQDGSPAERLADRFAHRSRRPSPFPERTHSSRYRARAEPAAGEVFFRAVAQLADQMTAQSTAQIAAFSALTQQLAEMRAVLQSSQIVPPTPRSRRASPTSPQPPHRQSALDSGALQGVPLSSTARPLALNPRATAHQLAFPSRNASHVQLGASQQAHQLAPPARIASPVPLGAAQQSHQLALFPLAPYALASPAPFALSALPALSSNPAESPQSGHLLAPLALPSLSLALPPSHLQYVPQYSQSEARVASTVVVPAVLQLGTTSALYAPALPATSQHTTRSQLAPYQLEAAVVQPAAHGAPAAQGAQPTRILGAPAAHGAHLIRIVGAHFVSCAQPVVAAGAQFASCAQPVFAAGAQFAVCAPTVSQVGSACRSRRSPYSYCRTAYSRMRSPRDSSRSSPCCERLLVRAS